MWNSNAQLINEPFSTAWEASQHLLRDELDPQIYSAYIEPLRLAGINEENCEFSIAAPSKFICTQVEKNFGTRIASLLGEHVGERGVTVQFVVTTEPSKEREPRYVVVKQLRKEPEVAPPSDHTSNVDDSSAATLNQRYTFSNFVVGNSNQFCHAAAMRVAELPGQSYNPLFIYGGVGLGKTHLLHSIGNAVLQHSPKSRVLYMSSEAFTNELIQALRHAKMDEFKKRLRNIHVLLIDDIQFICGKERTQEEFFHTFNALYGAKQQIVITSDKLPSEIAGIEERLQTRFSWGLTADLQAPDFETRVAILKRKASIEGFLLPEDVAHLIAEKVSSNVRELEGALTRLHAISTLQQIPITVKSAQVALKPLLQPKAIRITVEDIKKAVANHFSLKVSDMVSKRRTKNLSFPRHIAMYLCRKYTTASYPEIGAQFGNRDHSSVIHAANVVAAKVSSDVKVKMAIEEIERVLAAG